MTKDLPKRILFLCTGNYYRSRFAEIVFNHLAQRAGIPWTADSCGLRVQPDGVVNHGPLSPFAQGGLELRGIAPDQPSRMPRQACAADFSADLIIAVKESEHRPLIEKLFPDHLPRVQFWNIHDLDVGHPVEALNELEQRVASLVERLNRDEAPPEVSCQ
jgi:protein-tyrosine phosphatase